MGRRQRPKGYRQRQIDKQLARWQYFLRKEKQKIKQKNKETKGAVILMAQTNQEIKNLAEELRQATTSMGHYKAAWEAEKNTANVWLQENRTLRKQVSGLRKKIRVYEGLTVVLVAALLVIVGGVYL
ncbi:hypothetical protein [Cytobacillus kochii]|uniref:hypothetical protein n=1 Tax=Cytobacillus kochii TaxID=859143 RepID=UPI00402AD99B